MIRALVLTVGFVLVTVLIGWWAVPVVAFAWGMVAGKRSGAAMIAGVSAMTAWGLLLGWSAVLGPVGILVTKLGAVANVPGAIFVGLTLALPFLLAASAAGVTREFYR